MGIIKPFLKGLTRRQPGKTQPLPPATAVQSDEHCIFLIHPEDNGGRQIKLQRLAARTLHTLIDASDEGISSADCSKIGGHRLSHYIQTLRDCGIGIVTETWGGGEFRYVLISSVKPLCQHGAKLAA